MNDKCNPILIGAYPNEKEQLIYFFSLCEEHKEAAIVGPTTEIYNLDRMRTLFEDEKKASFEILDMLRHNVKFATFLLAVRKYLNRGECPGDPALVYDHKLYGLYKEVGNTFMYVSGVDMMAIPKSYEKSTVFEPLFTIKFGGDSFDEIEAEADRIKQEYPEYAEVMDEMLGGPRMEIDRSKYAESNDQREAGAA